MKATCELAEALNTTGAARGVQVAPYVPGLLTNIASVTFGVLGQVNYLRDKSERLGLIIQ